MTPLRPANTRRWVLWLSIAVWAIGGAAFSLTRTTAASHARSEVTRHGFCVPSELLTITRRTYAPGVCTIEMIDDGWRPLRVDVRLKAPEVRDADAPAVVRARISVNDGAAQEVALEAGAGERMHAIDVPPRVRTAKTIIVRIEANEPPSGRAPPVDVGTIDVVRVLTTSGRAWAAAIGALVGVIAWWLIVPPLQSALTFTPRPPLPLPLEERRAPGRGIGGGVFVLVWLALCLYFGVWALVRPPYQTPDEVQHHLRATAVLRHPWRADGDAWTLDPRFTNPLAQWTPGVLDKLFFDPRERLRLQEITAIQAIEWPASDARPAPETYRRAIASYPTLYYLALFGLAEPVTRALGLTPYQSTFAYRLASVVLAALLWTMVHRALRRADQAGDSAGGPAGGATRALATPVVLFLVLNPMVAFMSSGINPDGVNVPLATLAILLLWRVLTLGTGVWPAALALIATAWTKPSGFQVLAAFAFAAGLLWLLRQVSFLRLRLAGAVVSASALIAWCGFYAWSPPRFLGGAPVPDTFITFLTTRWLALPETWVAYWGRLGWLEYSLPEAWYVALLAITVLSLICVLARSSGSRLFAGYTALFLVGFLVVTLAGEFAYLPTAGYFLQGRHLLPASIGLAALMLHRVRGVRVAFLALLLAMNVLLLHETVLRYYTRGWSAVPATLPFSAGSAAKPR